MLKSKSTRAVLTGFALLLGGTTSALAASLPLSYSQTSNGVSGPGSNPTLSADSYYYGNTLGNLTTTIATGTGAFAGIHYEFYDDYVFTVTNATVNSISSTVSLSNIFSIDNLSARLYSTNNPAAPVVPGSSISPVGSIIEAWSTNYISTGPLGGSNVTVSVLNDIPLHVGTYVLELRGSVSGSSGGSYSGVLNVAAVPVPATLWLFGSALGGLISIRRRAVV